MAFLDTRARHFPDLAEQLKDLGGTVHSIINLQVFAGPDAWDRAREEKRPRLVVVLDQEASVTDYDLTCCERLSLSLHAQGCDYYLARSLAVRACEHGAALVVLFHRCAPESGCEFFFGEQQ